MYRAAIRKQHGIGQLALCGQVARNVTIIGSVVHEVRRPVASRIENKNWLFQFKPHYVDRSDVVRIASDEHKAFRLISECIAEQRRSEVDIGSFFLELHNMSHSVSSAIARFAFWVNVRKPNLVPIVVSFHHLDGRQCIQGLDVDTLSGDGLRIMWIRPHASSEELDKSYVVVVAKQGACKGNGIKPLAGGSSFQQTVVEIEAVNIYDRLFHSRKKLQGPHAFRLEAPPRIARGSRSDLNPSRGSSRIVANHLTVCKRIFRKSRFCELKSQMRHCNVRWTCVASGVANRNSKHRDFIGVLAKSAFRALVPPRRSRFRA